MSLTLRRAAAAIVCSLVLTGVLSAQSVQSPDQFFGFAIGTDGELARYPRVVDYLQHLAERSDRVAFEEIGKTTMGNPYVLATFSAPANLKRIDRLVAITHRLADPRGLSEAEAAALAREGVPFYFLYATIHSTEVGNGQAIVEIAHRLATDDSPEIREILDNVVVLMVPSQNPDGQVLVVDHWYRTRGTPYDRVFPDLYHRYAGHDDNRDWFMLTQKETRYAIGLHSRFKPQLTHDMHQMGSTGARIFVPPYQDPYDPNVHPLVAQGQTQVGQAMAAALIAEGKGGVVFNQQYDLWTPARQYMVYHGQPRILTEIASVNLADPIQTPGGRPFGPQERRWNFPLPYEKATWRLRDIIDYGSTAVFAGLKHMAKYRTTWLENFYKVHRDWVTRDEAPYAFVISADQADPFETYELLEVLDAGEVEIHRARAPFRAGGRDYPAGSWVIQLAQPYGAFAKTMLERQVYPDLRYYPGGPPIPPYDVTGHTLGLLMGVEVDRIDEPVRADLELLEEIAPVETRMPARPSWAYLVPPTSNAAFLAFSRLQKSGVPVFRASSEIRNGEERFAPGTWIVPSTPAAATVLEAISNATGLPIAAADRPLRVEGFRLKAPTRVGLWKAANNMPAGWLMWLFEQYELNHQVISSVDFEGDLADKYDVIVLPSGTSRSRIVNGLDSRRHDESWRWAYGVGETGWAKLRDWVRGGGTLVAVGSASETARDLLALPIEPVLPERGDSSASSADEMVRARQADEMLKEAFQSPARLIATLRDRVVDPTSLFYCPGSLLKQEHNVTHPVGFGMPASWPVFFESDQAYRLLPSFDIKAEVVSRYPDEEQMAASGWLLGDEFLRNQANVIAFTVGRGTVVTLASQVDFRTQTRGTFKLLFNAIVQGPATKVSAEELSALRVATN